MPTGKVRQASARSAPPEISGGSPPPWAARLREIRGIPAYAIPLAGVAVLSIILGFARGRIHVRLVNVIYLAYLLFVASGVGRGPAIAATLVSAVVIDYFFLPPVDTWVTTPEHWAMLGAFVLTGMLAGQLAERVRRRATEAEVGRAEIASLYDEIKEQSRDFQKQARLLDLAHDAIMVMTQDRRLTFWNQGAVDTYGWSKEEARGKVAHELLQTEFPEPIENLMGVLEREGFWEGELQHVCRNGSRLAVASRWVLTADDMGLPWSVLEINNDITARKDAEQKLLKAHEELEIRVRDRTVDLTKTNEALEREVAERRHAQTVLGERSRELARSNAELEQFAYIASHDLQEPLRMVAGYLRLLDRDYGALLDGKGKQYLGYASDGAQRMQMLIDDLLAYSRMGHVESELEQIDSAMAVQWAAANLKSAMEENGARIICGPLPKVRASRTLLVELFQNLISNAIKFRSGKPPEIHITAERASGGWRFAVKDNGIGIEPHDFERIFVIFHRPPGARRYAGSGIGLAVCRRIVDRHGGRIWVESEPGQGATFLFILPDAPQSGRDTPHRPYELAT